MVPLKKQKLLKYWEVWSEMLLHVMSDAKDREFESPDRTG